jgi:hypothetical protein
MNSDFVALLEQAGLDTRERGFWQRIVMVDNRGILPVHWPDEDDLMTIRGFNALVLDRHGAPTHFCKCRPPTREWIRQTELCTQMSKEPELRHVMPPAWEVGSADVHISISAYVPGRVLESTVSWMRPRKLCKALREIIQAMETVSRRGAIVAPGFFRGQTHVDLAAEAEWAFDAIPSPLLERNQAAILREAIAAAGTVRRVLQHGDLWARNILRYDSHWWLLDFDTFGRTQVPMYDACHLVRSSWALRHGRLQRVTRWTQSPVWFPQRTPSWMDRLRSSTPANVDRRTLAWACVRHGLTRVEAVGALAFYLIDMTARMYRRRARLQYIEPYLVDLSALADSLHAGETFADTFGDGL